VVGARSDELSACERRGKQREKGAGVILTTVRSSGGTLGRWEGDGARDQRRRLRAPMAAAVRVSSGARASATGSWGLGPRALPFIGVRGESLACAPRRPRRRETRSDSGSARVPVGREEEDAPTGRAHPSVKAGERAGRRTGPGEENGPTGLHGPREERKERKREMEGWAG